LKRKKDFASRLAAIGVSSRNGDTVAREGRHPRNVLMFTIYHMYVARLCSKRCSTGARAFDRQVQVLGWCSGRRIIQLHPAIVEASTIEGIHLRVLPA
jgi:hypothetical protein